MSIDSVRRLAIVKQRLSALVTAPVTTASIHELVRTIGCLQLDPTAIVARNHLLVLFSRLGPFDTSLVDSLLWDERLLYEYFAHQASIVPTDDRALHAALPPRWGDPHRTESWMTLRATAVQPVLDRLTTNAFVRASDFAEHAEKYESGWGARSEITDTLALLWLTGQIVPAGRDGRGRRWSLADTWFGQSIERILERPDAVRSAAVRALRMLGVATQQHVTKHFIRGRYPGIDQIWKSLAADGVIIAVDPGIKGEWYVHVDDLALLSRIDDGAFEPRTTFLSPFDNLICDRSRTLALWDFDFKLEIYVPRSRRWGYFVMPLLHDDRLVARFDLAMNRTTGALDVLGERWEPGWTGRRRPIRAVRRALSELATFARAAPRPQAPESLSSLTG